MHFLGTFPFEYGMTFYAWTQWLHVFESTLQTTKEKSLMQMVFTGRPACNRLSMLVFAKDVSLMNLRENYHELPLSVRHQ